MPVNPKPTLPAERIDEIPVLPSAFKARVVCVAVFALAAIGAAVWQRGGAVLDAFLADKGDVAILWQRLHVTSSLKQCFEAMGWVGAACAAVGVLGIWRNRITYHL
jgi:hypothetical protein